jgi:hypothetical protein
VRSGSKLLAPLLLVLAGAAESPAPQLAFSVPAEHRLIEGIASDGKDVWLSSVLDRTILERHDGVLRTIQLPAGIRNPLGLAWDARRHWLWIAADCPDLPGIEKCAQGALVAIDRAGRVRAQVSASPSFHPGDVSAAGGRVFVSDSQAGAVFAYNDKTGVLDPVIPLGVGRSAQGSALVDGHLIVADYRYGIASVDLATGIRTLLLLADGTPLNGVDGLARVAAGFVGVRNGTKTPAIVAFQTDGKTITDTQSLARGGLLKDPTQIAVSGDHLLIVGEAGWDAAAAGSDRAGPTPILSLAIPRWKAAKVF